MKDFKMATTSDPIADLLSRIRNALMRRAASTSVPYSRLKEKILLLLKKEGYIQEVQKEEVKQGFCLTVTLRYYEGEPVIQGLKGVSKPGRRFYSPAKNLPHVLSGHGMAVVSTSQGLMTDHEARKRKLGGEILFSVW